MKTTFLALCIFLCFISLLLYSRPTLNLTFIHTILKHNFNSISLNPLIVHPLINTTLVTLPPSPIGASKVLLAPHLNRRFAIFACSIHAHVLAYTFYTPLTAASWKRVGYDSIVVFVGDFTKPNVMNSPIESFTNIFETCRRTYRRCSM